jgi:hypothetical protein
MPSLSNFSPVVKAAVKWQDMVRELAAYDEASAVQAVGVLQVSGVSLDDQEMRTTARAINAHVNQCFTRFAEAWRESRIARWEKQ